MYSLTLNNMYAIMLLISIISFVYVSTHTNTDSTYTNASMTINTTPPYNFAPSNNTYPTIRNTSEQP